MALNIPDRITAGDWITWRDEPITIDGVLYSADTWQLRYVLRGPAALEWDAAAEGYGWRVILTAEVSAQLPPGDYAWAVQLLDGEIRRTADRGRLRVLPDPASLEAGAEIRTPAEIALAECEAAISGWKSSGGSSKRWKINGREEEYRDISELFEILRYWQARVRAEQSALTGRDNRVVYVRFRAV